jgi:hypothetical protein
MGSSSPLQPLQGEGKKKKKKDTGNETISSFSAIEDQNPHPSIHQHP